jgi:hypothetical protein
MDVGEIQLKFYEAVDSPNGWQRVRHLMLKLKKEEPNIVIEALLGVFFNGLRQDKCYVDQTAAGGLLWKLKPKYERNLKEDILRSFNYWNVSIEELPWYLAEAVGWENVYTEINTILKELDLDETSKKKAETYLYWLNLKSPEEFKKRLNEQWNAKLRG